MRCRYETATPRRRRPSTPSTRPVYVERFPRTRRQTVGALALLLRRRSLVVNFRVVLRVALHLGTVPGRRRVATKIVSRVPRIQQSDVALRKNRSSCPDPVPRIQRRDPAQINERRHGAEPRRVAPVHRQKHDHRRMLPGLPARHDGRIQVLVQRHGVAKTSTRPRVLPQFYSLDVPVLPVADVVEVARPS